MRVLVASWLATISVHAAPTRTLFSIPWMPPLTTLAMDRVSRSSWSRNAVVSSRTCFSFSCTLRSTSSLTVTAIFSWTAVECSNAWLGPSARERKREGEREERQ